MIRAKLDLKEKAGFTGSYVIRKWRAGTKDLLWESPPISNIVVSSSGYGRNLIMRQLGGDITYGIEIDSAAIGTGTNAPANSDTGLQTPVVSGIDVALAEATDNVLIVSFFIPDDDLANGTYNEFGIFIDSRLLARSLITPAFVKGSNEDTTVDYTLTLT